jgi:hypothetical protein
VLDTLDIEEEGETWVEEGGDVEEEEEYIVVNGRRWKRCWVMRTCTLE